MKFSQNTPVVNPTTLNNVQIYAPRDVMAYGTAGKGYDAMVGALGQVAKVVKEQQDDADAVDLMEARNKIMGSLTASMYGEKGLLTTGIGENAKGLEGRVTETVQKTFDTVSKQYNSRVQRALRGNLNENMANYQRIAAQQEGREFRKQKDTQYALGLQNQQDLTMANWQDENLLDSSINEGLRMADYRARDQGFSEMQRQQERRNVITAIAGGNIAAALNNEDYQTADLYLQKYGKYMNQNEVMKYQKQIRSDKQIVEERDEMDELINSHKTATGEPDWNAIEEEIKRRAKETKVVGGGGGAYFQDSSLNDEIIAAARKYNLDPALVAAVANAESSGTHAGANGVTTSSVGALGVMQLMPDTAASLGVDPYDRAQNVEGGAKYLRQMLDMFGGDVRKAVAAYNAGPGAVKDYNGVPPYKETQNYVEKILGEGGTYSQYKKLGGSGWNVDSGAGQFVGKRMDHGEVGCVEFVTKAGAAGGSSFLKDQLNKGIVSVPDLVANAGNRVIDFDASKLSKGDVIVYGDDDHVVIYDKGYSYYGNSSGHKDENGNPDPIGVHGSDYREMNGLVPTKIIKTGGSGGGSGRTVNAHDSQYETRMIRRMEAARADWKRKNADAQSAKLDNYWKQIQATDSAEEALEILNKANASEDYRTANAVESMVGQKYRGVFRAGGSNGGGSNNRTNSPRGRVEGVDGYTGKSGRWVSKKQYDEDQETIRLYNEHKKLQEDGLYKIEPDEQSRAQKAAERSVDVWNANYDDIGIKSTAKAWKQNKGNFLGTINTLVEETGMTQDEAARYLNKYLEWSKNDDE